jgi:hypothetical protein
LARKLQVAVRSARRQQVLDHSTQVAGVAPPAVSIAFNESHIRWPAASVAGNDGDSLGAAAVVAAAVAGVLGDAVASPADEPSEPPAHPDIAVTTTKAGTTISHRDITVAQCPMCT